MPFGEKKDPIGSGLNFPLMHWLGKHLREPEEFESNASLK